jgi:hypothetical protein
MELLYPCSILPLGVYYHNSERQRRDLLWKRGIKAAARADSAAGQFLAIAGRFSHLPGSQSRLFAPAYYPQLPLSC